MQSTMTRSSGVLVAACLVLSALSGCASKPVVALHHAAIRSASLRGLGLDVFLQVRNENSYDVEIRRVGVTVTIAERYSLPPIAMEPRQWLPAGETTLVRVPVAIPWAILPPLISETAHSTSVTYRVAGSADVTAVRMLGIERDNYPVDEEGTLSRQALIDAARGMVGR